MEFYAKQRDKRIHLSTEVSNALEGLGQVQSKVALARKDGTLDSRSSSQINNDLNTLLSVLSNPVFQRICKIQDSVTELSEQLYRHPSCTSGDFDITEQGKLVLKISPPSDRYRQPFDTTPLPEIPTSAVTHGHGSQLIDEALLPPITTPSYAVEFDKVVQQSSQGREIHSITLYKPEGSSLGFSVVGLKSQEKGELGIFVQEIQPGGIAARDGRLAESDQILAIDGQALDSAITHQQAIGILQQARGEVEIVVARALESLLLTDPLGSGEPFGVGQQPPFLGGERPSSPSEDSRGIEMVLNTEWAQVEAIHLLNDGTGLGFGIIGGRSTGVVVKTILPGGVADRDGRLQSGDHILQIGEVNLLGMGSDQVAAVLRQCGTAVRLVVARPVEPTSPDSIASQAPIVPTKILGDPEELERHLAQANGYANHYAGGSFSSADGQPRFRIDEAGVRTFDSLPEVEIVDVELAKDSHGLGITIAGYVCEKEELSGIFVKSISEGSAADVSGKIAINDRIVEVDGQSLQGFTNHQAVEVLRQTSDVVFLKLERYHHGSKYDQLQSAISHSEHKPPTPSSVSALSLPQVAVDSDGEEEEILAAEVEEEEEEMVAPTLNQDLDLEDLEILIDTRYGGEILPTVEAAIIAKWSRIMGPDCEIVVAQISKARDGGGLGISLEGTVDVEDGREVRPHHYIRSILADGPVGHSRKLISGDELLEVNGRRLLGLNHVEVVSVLKDLPMHVRIVCARRPGQPFPRPIDISQDRNAFAARNILGGSLQNLFQGSDRLVKAKSDGSLASTGTTGATDTSLSKVKSRSLEPLTGLAMWSSEPHIIELPKGDRGLGFSILDYQDPMNPAETVIVIRSLVPGGVAQQDGRLIPGDRLLAVNDINLENASLDQAVQALKGAPRGVVRIAVAKPLPIPDTATLSSPSDEEVSPPPLPISPPPEPLANENGLGTRDADSLRDQVSSMIPPVAERLMSSMRIEDLEPPGAEPNAQPRAIHRRVQPYSAELSIPPLVGSADSPLPVEASADPEESLSKEKGDRSSARTPADGEETVDENGLPLRTAPKVLLSGNATNGRDQVGGPPKKTVQSVRLTPQIKSETSTVYINTAGTESAVEAGLHFPTAQLPQVQKRVVTHVTIFPSPPPEVAQVTLAKDNTTVEAEKPAIPIPEPPPQFSNVVKQDSLEEEKTMVKQDSTDGGMAFVRESSSSTNTSAKSSGDEGAALLLAKHWGPERLVEVYKEPNKSLGISIVGGKVDLYNAGPDSGSAISGIFIKNVLPNSPAGKTGQLKTGSRILAVDDVDLRTASHEKAVEVIRAAGNPVRFLVQSLVQWAEDVGVSIDESETSKSEDTATSHTVHSISQSSTTSSQTRTESGTTDTSQTTTTSTSTTTRTRSGTENGSQDDTVTTSSSTESEKVTQKQEVISEEEDENPELVDEIERAAPVSGHDEEEDDELISKIPPPPVTPARTPSPELIQVGLPDAEKQEIQAQMEAALATSAASKKPEEVSEASDHSSEEDDELGEDGRQFQGRIRTKAGVEIDRGSAGNVRRSKEEIAADPEVEDEFGYTKMKIEKRWSEVTRSGGVGSLVVVDLERSAGGLGISLAGHRDRMKMAVFICGINPTGQAHRTKMLEVGDEILEVNGNVVYQRCHLNASALIKGLPHSHVKIVALRKPDVLTDLSVKPITQFPVSLGQEQPEDKYANYKGLRVVTLKKTGGGLGIMIMEGKHAELGQGIFISDIQEGSVAEQSGLFVGDIILAVNGTDFVGVDYEHAAAVLKKTEGSVVLVVCNATKAKEEKAEEKVRDVKKGEDAKLKPEPDKPKLPPKPSKIPSPSKLTAVLSSLRKSTSPTPMLLPPLTSPPGPTISTSTLSPTNILPTSLPKPVSPCPTMVSTTSVSPATSVSKISYTPKGRADDDKDSCPATCEIHPGKETTIEINKDRGLGISILGGQDTLLGSIIIQEVYPDGAASNDGRLKPGDQLLYVNNEDFQNITHSKALAALRQTPNRIKMVVFRDDGVTKEEDLYEVLDVELVKKSGKGLGLSIVSRKNGSGVYISDVVPGGTAESDGRLMKGDKILSVNGTDLKEASQEQAAAVLKTALGTIQMQIGRFKATANKRFSSSVPATISGIPNSDTSDSAQSTHLVDSEEILLKEVNESSRNSSPPSSITGSPPQLRTVVLERGQDGLGFSIVGGYGSPHGNLPIYVKTVFDKGAASREGSLKRGDQILSVNGLVLDRLAHHEAVTILKNAKGNVTLTILS